MDFQYNDPLLKGYRRELRQKQTPAEEVMWQALRAGKLDGVKFRRQFGVGSYILDFYSTTHRIAIEIDGGYHEMGHQPRYDEDRSGYLRTLDILVIRFTNEQVLKDLENCLTEIRKAIKIADNRIKDLPPLSPM